MKPTIKSIVLSIAAMMITALPVLAAENTWAPGERTDSMQKDECLLVSRNCGNAVDSYQERIRRLETEINKGTDVYTNDELKRLREQLDDYRNRYEYEVTNTGA